MLTMVTMMITDFATFCYSRARLQVKSWLVFIYKWRQEPDAESDGSSQPRIIQESLICIERLGGLLRSRLREAA
jgi:hypothetical protein